MSCHSERDLTQGSSKGVQALVIKLQPIETQEKGPKLD